MPVTKITLNWDTTCWHWHHVLRYTSTHAYQVLWIHSSVYIVALLGIDWVGLAFWVQLGLGYGLKWVGLDLPEAEIVYFNKLRYIATCMDNIFNIYHYFIFIIIIFLLIVNILSCMSQLRTWNYLSTTRVCCRRKKSLIFTKVKIYIKQQVRVDPLVKPSGFKVNNPLYSLLFDL